MVSEIEARIHLTSGFPRLREAPFLLTSPCDDRYNCIAWAANDNSNWWWPDPFAYWPVGVPRTRTVSAFKRAFKTLGYSVSEYEDECMIFEYVAIYVKNDLPEHAARQLEDGLWTSKLGPKWDISHTIDGLTGEVYGEPVVFMKRPRQ